VKHELVSPGRILEEFVDTPVKLCMKRLSTHSTSCPASSRRSHKCEPIKPAPPVMSSFFTSNLPRLWNS